MRLLPPALSLRLATLRPARRLWLWLPAGVVAAILLGWAGSWWYARAVSARVRSIAVLPFVDISPVKAGEWFGDGMAEETLDALARAPGLHVAGRTSAFRFQNKTGDIRQIGRQLGVAAVVTGSVLQAGGRLRVRVRMDRASDGYPLWSETFDRPAQAAFAVPQEIAAAIARQIQIRPAGPAGQSHQPPPEAWRAYLEGRYFFHRSEPEASDKAVERLEQAMTLDPEFALAWAWLSLAMEVRVEKGMARPNEAMPVSRDAAERAVALDPGCGEAHLALGIVRLQYDWDWADARQELDRAVQLNPESALALDWRGRWFASQGRVDEALAETARALALDPLSAAILGDMAGQYVAINQAERALPFASRAADINPDDAGPRFALAGVLWLAGEREKSRQMVEELRHSPAAAKAPAWMAAYIGALEGDPAGARQLLDEAEDLPEERPVPATAYARLAAAVDDQDRFFSWIEEAYARRDVQLPYLRLSPNLPQSDPRFAGFLDKMNLPAGTTGGSQNSRVK
jgi:TolB-like protein/Flp pilus assembly protein TadD